MAKLSQFRSDTRALNDGMWVLVDPAAFDDLEILSRGFTDAFIDAQTQKIAKAARPYGYPREGSREKIPNSEMRQINAELLRDFLILDVRNLYDEAGEPVSIKDFHAMLFSQAFDRLSSACWQAAGKVTTASTMAQESAVGNSPKPSETSSNGENSESA